MKIKNSGVIFENVSVRYGDDLPIFRDVSFTLESGSFHFLTGASGTGKSTHNLDLENVFPHPEIHFENKMVSFLSP
jgi:ABC-type ATPase involved in cell division